MAVSIDTGNAPCSSIALALTIAEPQPNNSVQRTGAARSLPVSRPARPLADPPGLTLGDVKEVVVAAQGRTDVAIVQRVVMHHGGCRTGGSQRRAGEAVTEGGPAGALRRGYCSGQRVVTWNHMKTATKRTVDRPRSDHEGRTVRVERDRKSVV